jgi:hypothetical protein
MVIADALTGKLSFMGVLDSVQPIAQAAPGQTEPPTGEEEPRFLVGPVAFVTTWWRIEEDGENGFEQQVIATTPDGRELILQPPSRFVMERPFNRIIHHLALLGLRRAGIYTLRVSLRQVGDEEWRQVTEYPLLLQEIPEPERDPVAEGE